MARRAWQGLLTVAVSLTLAVPAFANGSFETQRWQPTGAQNLKTGRSPAANYALHCSGCHGLEGAGLAHAGIPPFPGFIDKFFSDEQGRLYIMHVPGVISAGLPNDELAEVVNYIVDRWGEPEAEVEHFTTEEVARLRSQKVADVVQLRRRIARRLEAEGAALPPYPWP